MPSELYGAAAVQLRASGISYEQLIQLSAVAMTHIVINTKDKLYGQL